MISASASTSGPRGPQVTRREENDEPRVDPVSFVPLRRRKNLARFVPLVRRTDLPPRSDTREGLVDADRPPPLAATMFSGARESRLGAEIADLAERPPLVTGRSPPPASARPEVAPPQGREDRFHFAGDARVGGPESRPRSGRYRPSIRASSRFGVRPNLDEDLPRTDADAALPSRRRL